MTATQTELDYEERYDLPIHWLVDPHDRVGMDYLDYVERALKLLDGTGLSVLDAGCGDGYVSSRMIGMGHSVTGFDASPSAIAFARALVPEGTFVESDIAASPEATGGGPFDAALLMEVIEHVKPERHEESLGALRRQLRDGGQLILTVPSVNLPLIEWHYKHFSTDEIRALLARCGFDVRQIVFQHRLDGLAPRLYDSNRNWKLLTNRFYDLKFLRRLAARVFRERYGLAPSEDTAGRLIVDARAV
jgi:SAM-dependent methyltransferase